MLRRFPAVLAVLLLLALPAGAQPGDEMSARLLSFSGWTAPDRPLNLSIEVRNSGSVPLSDVAVHLTIRERIRSRSALRASLDGNTSAQGVLVVTTELLDQSIAPGGASTVQIQRDLGSLATSFRSGHGQSGVYPLQITVEGGGRSVSLYGATVFLASVPDTRLSLVWLMPVHEPLASNGAGAYDKALLGQELAKTGRIPAIADLLNAHPGAPLTLAPSGLLADQLLDISNGFPSDDGKEVPATDPLARAAGDLLARLRSAIAAPVLEVASATYGRASLASLIANGLAVDANRQVSAGRERVGTVFGRPPRADLLVDGTLGADARSARTYAALGATTLMLDPQVLRNKIEGRFGPDRVVDVRSSNTDLQALLVDAPIRQRLELTGGDPVLQAMGIAAETAGSYFELPALANGRMLVVATAAMPDPAVTSPLLDVLAQAPWLRMRTASDAAADPELAPAGEPQRLDTVQPANDPRSVQSRAARRQIDALGRVIAGAGADDELARLDRIVLASESADYDHDQTTAVSLARSARDRAQGHLAQIKVPPRRVTLTSRRGEVPVTVVNETGYSIRVRVRLDSQKVTFPTGAVRTIEITGKQHLGTVAFGLEARAAGSFPIAVRLETPDGRYIVGGGQILVRSTAVSAVTFMATAGGALFLVGAWARRALSRRSRRPATA